MHDSNIQNCLLIYFDIKKDPADGEEVLRERFQKLHNEIQEQFRQLLE